jgi:ribosomal-protein-alanine N-acetyltransferase
MEPLTLSDCIDAAQLHQAAFFKGWKETEFRASLQNPSTFGMKIREGHTLAGYVMWREIMDEAEILTLVIAPPHKRKGKGGSLLETLFTILKNKGIHTLFIEVAEDNQDAASFYIKHGFVFLSKRPCYYPREDNAYVGALNFIKKLEK